MAENQNIEYKESWRDEYMRWICGFANAQGGKLYIGVKDNGDVCGVDDAQRLLEEIPNKVRSIDRIINACDSEEFSTPSFRYDPSGFWTTFKFQYPERAILQGGQKGGQKSGMQGGQKGGQKGGMKSGMKSGMKNINQVTEYIFVIPRGQLAFPVKSTVGQIYSAIVRNKNITITALSTITGISRSTIQKHINKLKEYGIIRRVGPDKGGYWEIIAEKTK